MRHRIGYLTDHTAHVRQQKGRYRSHLLCGAELQPGGVVRGGRHIRYRREMPLNNLPIAILHKAGAPVEPFGDGNGEVTELS